MAFQLPALPSFQTNIPQMPSPLEQYGKMLQLRQLSGQIQQQQKMQPLQVEQAQEQLQQTRQSNEIQALQLQGQKAQTAYWTDPSKFDTDSSDFQHNDPMASMLGVAPDDPLMHMVRGLIKAGAPAPVAFAEAKNTLAIRQEASKTTQEQQAVLKNAFEQLREISGPILAEKDANKKQVLIDDALPGLATWAKFDPSLLPVVQGLHAGNFDAFANRLGAEEKALDFGTKQQQKQVEGQKVIDPVTGLSQEGQQKVAQDVAVAKATQPLKIQLTQAEQEARQRAMQGDPNVAGELLANGSLTLAELKTRGTTPQFIEQATLAAQKLKPTYHPADEVIAEQVAKSQSANQFFGSANSLIAKGGTLDQLDKLGAKIPQHEMPALNTVDDWQKLARGKGPLAGYAATALGVADDYGKVMGGGTASDSAREAALRLFSQAASPEQRAQAIQATRDAVQSQRDSRIGNNQFLKRQYGTEVGGTQSSGGMIRARDLQGKLHEAPKGTPLPAGWKAE